MPGSANVTGVARVQQSARSDAIARATYGTTRGTESGHRPCVTARTVPAHMSAIHFTQGQDAGKATFSRDASRSGVSRAQHFLATRSYAGQAVSGFRNAGHI